MKVVLDCIDGEEMERLQKCSDLIMVAAYTTDGEPMGPDDVRMVTLEFMRDEPVQPTLTPSEQEAFFQAVVDIKVNGENNHAFDDAVQMVTDRVFRNTYSREAV